MLACIYFHHSIKWSVSNQYCSWLGNKCSKSKASLLPSRMAIKVYTVINKPPGCRWQSVKISIHLVPPRVPYYIFARSYLSTTPMEPVSNRSTLVESCHYLCNLPTLPISLRPMLTTGFRSDLGRTIYQKRLIHSIPESLVYILLIYNHEMCRGMHINE